MYDATTITYIFC